MEFETGRRVLLIMVLVVCPFAPLRTLSAQYQSPSSGSAARDPYSQQVLKLTIIDLAKIKSPPPVMQPQWAIRSSSQAGSPLPNIALTATRRRIRPMASGAALQLFPNPFLSHQCQHSRAH